MRLLNQALKTFTGLAENPEVTIEVQKAIFLQEPFKNRRKFKISIESANVQFIF